MTNKTIDFLKVLHLRGPNIWTYRSVLEAWVDIHDLEDCPSNVIPGLPDRLTTLLPTLIEHRCSIGERGGFVKRLHDGTWPGHILEHVTLELQNLAGIPAASARPARRPSAVCTRWSSAPGRRMSRWPPSTWAATC
jgi:cyanophycin synthetase